ncbi:hypothetical protein HaLaN_24720 [Haematococcus lacustris]|uniref:Uncharacterized protein n=1 Tax=Haematococcus lacustris TaxID=44745 RepID=A0A699ZVQ2_HAELA|nr:hypothetical protein HaLaN_24720 [Haematococcus lacustris]
MGILVKIAAAPCRHVPKRVRSDIRYAAFGGERLTQLARVVSPMTDPTKAADVADWWARLKAAPAAAKLAHESLDAAITLLETVGPFLPPPSKQQCWVLGFQQSRIERDGQPAHQVVQVCAWGCCRCHQPGEAAGRML